MSSQPDQNYARSSLDRVFNALSEQGLRPTRHADHFMACCPVHGDNNPSLSVTYKKDTGLTTMWCHSCQAPFADIVHALGLEATETFDAPLERRPAWTRTPQKRKVAKLSKLPARLTAPEKDNTPAPRHKWVTTATYEYANADGELVQKVIRQECKVSTHPEKRFTQSFINPFTGKEVTTKPEGFIPALYHQPDIVQAVAAGREIWICEGEKDTDNARATGLDATTNAQGALSFPEVLVEPFHGAVVNVVADRDTAGYKRAANLHAVLSPVAKSVRLLLPATVEAKSDLTDHLEAGHEIAGLVEFTAGEARMLAALGDVRGAIKALDVCLDEARARVQLASRKTMSKLDAQDELLSAGRWAKESQLKFERLQEMYQAVPFDAATASELETSTHEDMRLALEEAADKARQAHTVAKVKLPRILDPEAPEKPAHALHEVIVLPTANTAAAIAGFDGGFGFDPEAGANEGIEYLVRNGDTVELKWERSGDTFRKRYKRIMRGWAEVQSMSIEDDGTATNVAPLTHEIAIKFFRFKPLDDGKKHEADENGRPVVESKIEVFDSECIRDGSWVSRLPFPGMVESSSRKGKDAAWDAIFLARPTPANRDTVYTAPGWRESETGPFFVHGGGAIAKGGTLSIKTGMPKALSPFKLPEPVTDGAALADAWATGTVPLMDLPARIMAPLLGVVWESVFHPVPMITHLQGGRASAKTSTARQAMHYFAPSMKYLGDTEILSGANMGGTTIGLVRSLGMAHDVPILIDDIAPDGDVKKAQKKLMDLARLIFNGTGRVVGKQRGGVSVDEPTRATVITTGEMGITGSSLTRMICLPLDPGTIPSPGQTFGLLEREELRAARGQLGASLIQWIADHRTELQAEHKTQLDNLTAPGSSYNYWHKRLESLPHDEGHKGRLITGAMSMDHGIRLMLRMLRSNDALSTDQANEFYRWAEDGIYQAIALQDTDGGDSAEQFLHYLREALGSHSAHLTDEHGTAPENPSGKGWVQQGSGEYLQWRPSGARLGVIKDDRAYIIPSVALGTVMQVSQRADEIFDAPKDSIASALAAHNWLRVDGAGKRAVGRRIDGVLSRVWDIPLAVLNGDEHDDNGGNGDHGPTPPALFDNPGAAPSPTAPPTPPTPPAPAAGPAGIEKTGPDGRIAVETRLGEPQICAWCSQQTETAVDEVPLHWSCYTGAEHSKEPPVAPSIEPLHREEASTEIQAAEAPSDARAIVPANDKRRPAAARTMTKFRASLAVLHDDGVWLPSGERIELAAPLRHIGDAINLITQLNLGTAVTSWRNEAGQLYATAEGLASVGIDLSEMPQDRYAYTKAIEAATKDHPFLVDAMTDGWKIGGLKEDKISMNATTRAWSDKNSNHRGVLVMLPAMRDDFDAITEGNPTPATIARRLQKFASALNYPYTVAASSTGLDLMKTLHWKDRETLFAPSTPIEPSRIRTLEADALWSRVPTSTELEHKYLHAYDRGGSYLAGVSGLDLGIGDPTYHPSGVAFDKKKPGYWRVNMPEKTEWLAPNPLDPQNRAINGLTWVSTPTLDVAVELGYELEVTEAYVWEKKSRILDTWYERVRDARTLLDTADPDDIQARNLLKTMYVQSLGLMASYDWMEGKPMFAPERYHFIQARSRANIIRRINQIGNDHGRWPVAVTKDTILYTSDERDPVAAWPGLQKHYGRGLGQFKYEGSALMADHQQFLTGSGYKGKDKLEMWEA